MKFTSFFKKQENHSNDLALANEYWKNCFLPLYKKDFPIVVCWSAKSGCTTILKWFLYQNGLLDDAVKFNPWVQEYREKVFQFGEQYKIDCTNIFQKRDPEKFIIKIIRDPYKRAVSSFLHFLRYAEISKNWLLVKKLEEWKLESGISHQVGLSFFQFMLFILNQKANNNILDPHIEDQYKKNQDPRVNQYIPIEELANRISIIENEFKLSNTNIFDLSLSVHNNLRGKKHSWPEDAAFYPATHDSCTELGNPPNEIFLSRDLKILIKSVYINDIANYSEYYK